MPNGHKDTLEIGPKLRTLRRSQQLSLRALAAKTGFSASFLSQVELGQVSPSIASLDQIAGALGVTFASLLSPPRTVSGPILQRRGARELRSEWSRATAHSLLPEGSDDRVGVVLVALEPKGRTGKTPEPHGGKELAVCIRGRPALLINDQRHELGPGDSIFYDAAQPMLWRNDGARPAEVLLVGLGSGQPGVVEISSWVR